MTDSENRAGGSEKPWVKGFLDYLDECVNPDFPGFSEKLKGRIGEIEKYHVQETPYEAFVSAPADAERDMLSRFGMYLVRNLGFVMPEEREYGLLVAMGELLINALEHGCKYSKDRTVTLRLSRYTLLYRGKRQVLVGEVSDDGDFEGNEKNLSHLARDMARYLSGNILQYTDPAGLTWERKREGKRPGGYGLFLAKDNTDAFALEKPNTVRFMMFFPRLKPAETLQDALYRI